MGKAEILTVASVMALASAVPAQAATMTEDFEAAFPAWESGWFGANTNAQSCYGAGADRGNNPDGLWIASTGQGCTGTPVNVVFASAFAQTLTSFSMDVAGFSPTTLTFFDAFGNMLSSTAVALTFGGTQDPGIYNNYGVTSGTGIGGFSFSGLAAGNTSIDNLVANGAVGIVPEPSAWALIIAGFSLVGAAMRRREAARIAFA